MFSLTTCLYKLEKNENSVLATVQGGGSNRIFVFSNLDKQVVSEKHLSSLVFVLFHSFAATMILYFLVARRLNS